MPHLYRCWLLVPASDRGVESHKQGISEHQPTLNPFGSDVTVGNGEDLFRRFQGKHTID